MKKIQLDILPLLLSFGILLVSLITTSKTIYIFSDVQYIGAVFIFVSAVFYFINKVAYNVLFSITLLLGLIGVLDFYHITYGIEIYGPRITFIFIALLTLHFAILFSTYKQEEIEDPLQPINLNENLIQSFMHRLKDKPVKELQEYLKDGSKYTNEAKEAATRILDKKVNSSNTT